MSEANSRLIAIRLGRSKKALRVAELMFENDFVGDAASKLYYACFYAVTALLLTKNVNAKKHSGVKQMFGLHFVSTGLFSVEVSRYYTELFEMRQEVDYEDILEFDREEVSVLFAPAKQLITQIEEYINAQTTVS